MAVRDNLVELFLGGAWVDITAYVYQRNPIDIGRGQSAEANTADPSTCTLTVNNRDGRFSPRYPTGAYYGDLTRNVPLRVSVSLDGGMTWLRRFHGYVAEWPQRWDPTGGDLYVPVQAAGELRRLGQGSAPLKSAMFRGRSTAADVVAYWPCEDATGAAAAASAVAGHPPMRVVGSPSFAAYTAFDCSAALPTLGNARLLGTVPAYTATNEVEVRFLVSIPAGGTTNNAIICRVRTGGSAYIWDLVYTSGGNLTLKVYDNVSSALLVSDGPYVGGLDGGDWAFLLQATQDGADIDYRVGWYEILAATTNEFSGTIATDTVTHVVSVDIDPNLNMDSVAVGHVVVFSQAAPTAFSDGELNLANAYSGRETAVTRISRLCAEEDVAVTIVGITGSAAGSGPTFVASRSSVMGSQLPKTLVDLLREAATTDGGVLYEPRDAAGLVYRTRNDLANRAATATLDYAASELTGLEPVDDDQRTRNAVIVNRQGGSSASAVLEEGALSVQAPPDGVGRYEESVTISQGSLTAGAADGPVLADQAGWRLHLGTVDEPRFPVLRVNLAGPELAGDVALAGDVLDVDVAHRLVVQNPLSPPLAPDDLSVAVQGINETVTAFEHVITFNATPESPWHLGEYDSADRYTSDGSTLGEDLTTTETGVDVATASGPLWSDADGDFDILVGGERMTVTAISGATSPQTFTVTRSVNGVVKAHSTGAAVELFRPVYYSM